MTRPEILDATFAALADPTRRAVIRALMKHPRRAGELAEQVSMSAPALSRHLKVLRAAGLIVEESVPDDARVSLYRIEPAAFAPARTWLEHVERHWEEQLQSFKAYAERTRPRGRGT